MAEITVKLDANELDKMIRDVEETVKRQTKKTSETKRKEASERLKTVMRAAAEASGRQAELAIIYEHMWRPTCEYILQKTEKTTAPLTLEGFGPEQALEEQLHQQFAQQQLQQSANQRPRHQLSQQQIERRQLQHQQQILQQQQQQQIQRHPEPVVEPRVEIVRKNVPASLAMQQSYATRVSKVILPQSNIIHTQKPVQSLQQPSKPLTSSTIVKQSTGASQMRVIAASSAPTASNITASGLTTTLPRSTQIIRQTRTPQASVGTKIGQIKSSNGTVVTTNAINTGRSPPQLSPMINNSAAAASLHQQKLTQSQPQRETTTVFMDTIKKEIISQPSLNLQSQSLSVQQRVTITLAKTNATVVPSELPPPEPPPLWRIYGKQHECVAIPIYYLTIFIINCIIFLLLLYDSIFPWNCNWTSMEPVYH